MDVFFDIYLIKAIPLGKYKSGGLLIALESTLNVKWKEWRSNYETILLVCIYGRNAGWEKNLLITCAYIPLNHLLFGKRELFDELHE